jgi:hypothetical protein
MRTAHIPTACLFLALLSGGCDETAASASVPDSPQADPAAPTPPETAKLEPGKTAASFRLQSVVELVKGKEVADAPALETTINDPDAGLNAVDLDADGVTDFVEVIEEQKGGKTTLKFRAIPSSKQDQPAAKVGVVIATVALEIEKEETIVVHGTYTEHIEHDVHVHVYHHEEPVVFEHGIVVLPVGCFFHYVFVFDHEPYHGHFHHVVIDVHHDVPEVHHVHVHKKHKKHKHKKHKGHGHGHGHGVVVTW